MAKRNWKNALNATRATSLLLTCILILGFGMYTLSAMTSATFGQDSISVAVYAPEAAATSSGDLDINCNDGTTTANYDFYVSNTKNGRTTQVTMEYDVVVKLGAALPEGILASVDGVEGTVSSDGLTYTFSNDDWSFEPGIEESHSHVLSFTADKSKLTSDYVYSGIAVTVKTTQTGA